MRKVFTGLTALLMLAVVLQFFLAGSGAFDTAPNDESFGPHRALGYLNILLAVAAALVGALAKIPGRLLGMTVLVVGLTLLQPVIAGVATGLDDSGGSATTAGKLVFGFHAVNGLTIVAVLGTIVRRSRELSSSRRAKTGSAVSSDGVAGIRPSEGSASEPAERQS